jgi:hypothetical protein
MRMDIRPLIVACCLGLALLAVGTWAYGQSWGPAQPVTPTVVSGADIGFRIEGTRGDTPIGRLVIRVNGEWVEPDLGSGVRKLTGK